MANQLICFRGLPGSGKSYEAEKIRQADPDNWVIVEKDQIRAELELTGWTWSPSNEQTVILRRDQLIIAALRGGRDVISSDTNLSRKHEITLRGIAAECGAEFEVHDLTGVPVQTCIQRDSQREGKAQVGKEVILKMAKDYKIGGEPDKPPVVPYVPNLSKPKVILVDLDGTLAHTGGRRDIFNFDLCDQDDVDERVRYFLKINLEYGKECKVIFVTGREEKYRDKTTTFLERAGFYGCKLLMRPTGDFRNDAVIKLEIFDREIRDNYNVFMCLDDRDRVVKMYRSLGLVVWQVREGNF